MTRLWLDFETASLVDLSEVGVHNYASHPSTHILMAAFAEENGPVQLWEPKGPVFSPDCEMHHDLFDFLMTDEKIIAWNCTFERLILKYVLKWDIPASRWEDSMITSRFLSMPGKLESVCEILKLPPNMSKKDGDRLKDLFCSPAHPGGVETLFGVSEPRYNDWDTHPKEWQEFGEYCKSDVTALRTITELLAHHPLPKSEVEGFLLSEKINDVGVPADLELVQKMDTVAIEAHRRPKEKIEKITGIANANSRDQLLEWLKTQGYIYGSLDKPSVKAALNGLDITSAAAEVLALRQESSKTSDKKLKTLMKVVSPDGFVRDQFVYCGAATGRFSSYGVQFHNLPRCTKEVGKNLDRAIELLKAGDYGGIEREFSSVMDVVAGCIRSCFAAPDGRVLLVVDYNAIENRILGFLTGCEKILDVFRRGEDPYLKFAEILYKIPYLGMVNIIDGKHEPKPEYKDVRQNSKPPVLAAGYQLAAGEEVINKDGDTVFTGLRGYAANIGIEMDQELAEKAVRVFRSEYKEVVDFWWKLEESAIECVRSGRKLTLGPISMDKVGQTFRMILPSGRPLHYIRPLIEKKEFRGKMKDTLTFEGGSGKANKWVRKSTYSGKLTENLCQAIARDVLLEGLKAADKAGLQVCAHVHDEILVLADESEAEKSLQTLKSCMQKSPSWAESLPLGADGFITKNYKKG